MLCRCKSKSEEDAYGLSSVSRQQGHQTAQSTDDDGEARVAWQYRDSGRTCVYHKLISGALSQRGALAALQGNTDGCSGGWNFHLLPSLQAYYRFDMPSELCEATSGQNGMGHTLHDCSHEATQKIYRRYPLFKARDVMLPASQHLSRYIFCAAGGGDGDGRSEGGFLDPSSRRFPAGRASARCPRDGGRVAEAAGRNGWGVARMPNLGKREFTPTANLELKQTGVHATS